MGGSSSEAFASRSCQTVKVFRQSHTLDSYAVTTAYRLGDLGWSLHLPGPQFPHWLKGHSDVFHRWCSEV